MLVWARQGLFARNRGVDKAEQSFRAGCSVGLAAAAADLLGTETFRGMLEPRSEKEAFVHPSTMHAVAACMEASITPRAKLLNSCFGTQPVSREWADVWGSAVAGGLSAHVVTLIGGAIGAGLVLPNCSL
jgi:hypothetical protein